MIVEIYNKLDLHNPIQMDENNKPIPTVRIIKEGKNYIVFNIKDPNTRFIFFTSTELLSAVGSPATRPDWFDDQTGENLFKGR